MKKSQIHRANRSQLALHAETIAHLTEVSTAGLARVRGGEPRSDTRHNYCFFAEPTMDDCQR